MNVNVVGACRALLSPLLLLFALTLQALPDDRSQPIRIIADSATRDESSGTTQYEGNVELTQGSLVIKAERLIVSQQAGKTRSIIAEGLPASLQQTPSPEQTPITASAEHIEYYQAEDLVRLTKNARIQQDGAVVSGAVIDYLVSEQQVRAHADQKTQTGQRVEVFIPPTALERDNNP